MGKKKNILSKKLTETYKNISIRRNIKNYSKKGKNK
jgi:hypothetical protein